MINSAAPPVLPGGPQPQPVAVRMSQQPAADPAPVELKAPAPEQPAKPWIQFDPQKLHENLKEAIAQLNKQLADSGRTLGIKMDDVLNSPVVTVKSTKTGEVIRQIPSEAVIKAAHTIEQLKGLLVDEMS